MPVEFKTGAHEKAFEKARDYLFSLFGDVNVKAAGEAFAIQEGSSFVYIRAFPIGTESAGIEVFSYVVIEVEIDDELMRHLLTYNLRLVLGCFGLALAEGGKGSVILTHTLLADTLSQDELYSTVCAVARVADEFDDKLASRFGGMTTLGKFTETHYPDAGNTRIN